MNLEVKKIRPSGRFHIYNEGTEELAQLEQGQALDFFETKAIVELEGGGYEFSYKLGLLEGFHNKASAQRIVELVLQGTLGPLKETE